MSTDLTPPFMCILHLESGLNSGGQEYRTICEVKWLNAAGHQTWIACNPDSEIFQQGLAEKLPMLPLVMRRTFSPTATWNLYQLVRKLACDVVHIHSPIDAWIAVPLRWMGIPIVRTRHITNPVRPNFFGTFCYRYGCNHLIPTADVIRKMLEKDNGIPPTQMTVIGEGVDTSQFHPDVDGAAFRALWGAEPEDVLFGCVGMLRPEKGQKTFIQAAARIWKRLPRARFVLIGDNTKPGSIMCTKYRTQIQKNFGYDAWQPKTSIRLSKETPILMHGHELDIARATAALDVAVIPSHMEAQSRTAPEALCLGKPVIASKVGGLPEIVHDGKNGLLVVPKDADELAKAMMRLATDQMLRSRLTAAAVKEGTKQFSLNDRMTKTLDVYRKTLQKKQAVFENGRLAHHFYHHSWL